MAENGMDLERRLELLEQQNALLLATLANNGGISGKQEEEIINNGWRVMFNPKHKNPDNMDWAPGSDKKQSRNLHVGNGKWEWGYEDPDTGRIKWSGKLIGERPPGPPEEPPVPFEKLKATA